MKIFPCLFVLFISFFSFSLLHANGPVEVRDAWVLEAPPGMKVMAAYMQIQNQSGKDQIITHISSADFRRVEMHRTEFKNEQARMIKQSTMKIQAGEAFTFKPGGHHLMLIGPASALKRGDEVELTLVFESNESLSVTAVVRKFDSLKMNHGMQQ